MAHAYLETIAMRGHDFKAVVDPGMEMPTTAWAACWTEDKEKWHKKGVLRYAPGPVL